VSLTLGQRVFLEMGSLRHAGLPHIAGLYAIFGARASRNPRGPEPLFIGHTDDLAARLAAPEMHAGFALWAAHAGGESALSVAVHLMPDSDEAQRGMAVQELVELLDPPCNRSGHGLLARIGARFGRRVWAASRPRRH
jgi:hypothetical protein